MRVVLYTYDMEPITVIDLPMSSWEFLERHGQARLPVFESLVSMRLSSDPPSHGSLRVVNITAERLRRGGQTTLMLFTGDEESALLLRSELLPGQIKDRHEDERAAFARGFLAAIQNLGM